MGAQGRQVDECRAEFISSPAICAYPSPLLQPLLLVLFKILDICHQKRMCVVVEQRRNLWSRPETGFSRRLRESSRI